MRLKLLIGFLIVLVVGALAVGAFAAYQFFFSPKHDDAIALVPEESWVYFSFFLDPSTQQKMAIEDLLAKTPLQDFDEAAKRLRELFDDGLEGSGCTFEEDFEPWIGDQIAGFVLPPDEGAVELDAAGLIAVEDEDAARDAYYACNETDIEVEEEKSYGGVDYEITSSDDAIALVDGFAIIGTENGVKAAIDARDGGTLEESERYQDAFRDLTEDRLAALYVDFQPAIDALGNDPATTPQDIQDFQSLFGDFAENPITATLSVRPNAIVLEAAGAVPKEGFFRDLMLSASSDVLTRLPGDSWAAFGIGNIGDYVQGTLDSFTEVGIPGADQELLERQVRKETGLDLQNDILGWMGDLGVFVRGTSLFSIDGGVVIEARDTETATGTVVALAQYLAQQGVPVSRADIGDARGFRVAIPGAPKPVNVVVGNGRAVVAYGDEATMAALSSQQTLAEDEGFADAAETVQPDFKLSTYVEMAPIVQLIESSGVTDATYNEDVKPFLESVKYFAVGNKVTDEKVISRLIVGVE